MRLLILLICLYFPHFLSGAEHTEKPFPKNDFIAPFTGEIDIIGTFCELRNNHFHGGLDIRTGGKIGRHVLAVADGYVSRINISSAGYGKALYITHANGYTSVYAHLHDFPEKIKWYITRNQYLLEKSELELFPEKDLLLVKQGEMVAWSGNTGASQGPHLHFEIRETASEAPVNPLLFGIKMYDRMAPAILNLYIYRKDSSEKLQNGHYPSIALPMYQKRSAKGKKSAPAAIGKHVLAYGTYAFGANLKDYAKSAGDNNGVNYIKIYRDDELVYDCRIERVLFSQMRMHNNYIDFRRHKQAGIKMHKLFKDDGSTLFFWEHSPGDGWFEIKDSSAYRFRIVVSDVYGHSSEKRFVISGAAEGRQVKDYMAWQRSAQLCVADKENLLQVNPDFRLLLPKNALYADYRVSCNKVNNSTYTIGNVLVPLDKPVELQYRLSAEQLRLAGKFTVRSADGRSYGGTLVNGNWLSVPVKEFGTYQLFLDTIKPSIQVNSLNKNGYFSFSVADATSGIQDFDFYINGHWVLLEYQSGLIFGRIPNKMNSGYNTVVLKVRDKRNNERTYTKIIYTP